MENYPIWRCFAADLKGGLAGRATVLFVSPGYIIVSLHETKMTGILSGVRITVGANILISVLIVTPTVPPVYQAVFTIPVLALTSSMACRVFRSLRFNTFENDQTRFSTLAFGHGADNRGGHPSSHNSSDASTADIDGTLAQPKPLYPVIDDIEKGENHISVREVHFGMDTGRASASSGSLQ